MSAENYLFLRKYGKKYRLSEMVFEAEYNRTIKNYDTLEEAVKAAKDFMDKEYIEYGLRLGRL